MKIQKTEKTVSREVAIQIIIDFFVTVIIDLNDKDLLAEHLLGDWTGLCNMTNKELEDLASDLCIEEFFEDNNINY